MTQLVKRCKDGECVEHPVDCTCKFCLEVEQESYVVTEQGMFGDLLQDFELDTNHSQKNAK